MATFLFDDIIFGPVVSRRLGSSLGINLLPVDKKVCNFNCVYCECGWTRSKESSQSLPTVEEIRDHLNQQLSAFKEKGQPIDAITFAGNGEPTLHPDFDKIVDYTIEARNAYFPAAKIVVLSNGSKVHIEKVRSALLKVDEAVLKLDSAFQRTNLTINKPRYEFDTHKHIEKLKLMDGCFTLQTLFVKGIVDEQSIDNSTPEEVNEWLEIVKDLKPQKVMIYTIARDTAASNLEKVPISRLKEIEKLVQQAGISTLVSA